MVLNILWASKLFGTRTKCVRLLDPVCTRQSDKPIQPPIRCATEKMEISQVRLQGQVNMIIRRTNIISKFLGQRWAETQEILISWRIHQLECLDLGLTKVTGVRLGSRHQALDLEPRQEKKIILEWKSRWRRSQVRDIIRQLTTQGKKVSNKHLLAAERISVPSQEEMPPELVHITH